MPRALPLAPLIRAALLFTMLAAVLPAAMLAQAPGGDVPPSPSSVVLVRAGLRAQPPLGPTWPDSMRLIRRPRRAAPALPRPSDAEPPSRRERIYTTVGMLVGAGAAYVACTAHRPADVTREALALAGTGCALFGGLIGYTIGGLASVEAPRE